MPVIGRYRVPISDTIIDILAVPVILKVSNNGGVDMTALLRRIRLTILGKELLHEITEDAWNDGYTHGKIMELVGENKKLTGQLQKMSWERNHYRRYVDILRSPWLDKYEIDRIQAEYKE